MLGVWAVLSRFQQRCEGSLVGEALISALVSVVVLIGIVWNLPDSEVKRVLTPILQPIAAGTGLEQGWRMYAPDPIRRLENVEVVVTMADGGQRVWTPPSGDRVIDPFAWYRWQKFKEQVVRDPVGRAGLAHWVIGELTEPSDEPTRVEMILRTEELAPPGKDGPRTTSVETLYEADVAGSQ